MKIFSSIVLGCLLSLQMLFAAESPCILEFRKSYTTFFSEIVQAKSGHTGSSLVIEMEKKYRFGKQPANDTITYIFSPPQRVKMYNRSFIMYSDGAQYIVIIPSLHKIAIQRMNATGGSDVSNPFARMKELAELLITEKNFQSCLEFTNVKNKKCKEIILKAPTEKDKPSPVETVHYVMDAATGTLLGASVHYKKMVELQEEKYAFTNVNMKYEIPWDLMCPLEETVYDTSKKLKKEYKNFTVVDMRKQPKTVSPDVLK